MIKNFEVTTTRRFGVDERIIDDFQILTKKGYWLTYVFTAWFGDYAEESKEDPILVEDRCPLISIRVNIPDITVKNIPIPKGFNISKIFEYKGDVSEYEMEFYMRMLREKISRSSYTE